MDRTPSTQAPLAGIWLPLITPFANGELDTASVARLAAHYDGQPIDGVILAATTGEGLVLDDTETERLVRVVAETTGGRKRVFLGLCGSDTRKLAKRVAAIESWPVDGYLIYNIPYRTGVNLLNDTLLRLAELPNIVGVKDCCANAAQTSDLLRRRKPDFTVLTGEDALFYGMLAEGADGGILATAHVDTAAYAAVRDAVLAGRLPEARARWDRLVDLVRLLFVEPNPAPIKHCLWRLGLIASPELRLPMTGISGALGAELDRQLAAPHAA